MMVAPVYIPRRFFRLAAGSARLPLVMWMFAVVLILSVGPADAAEPDEEPTTEGVEFFEKHVRPLLATRCQECHGEKKQEAGLRFDRKAHALRGSDAAPVIAPGKPDESPMISAVRYETYEMPPRAQLAEHEIAALTKWVELGAPWPDDDSHLAAGNPAAPESIARSQQEHWAYQPVEQPPTPAVQDQTWGRSSIDAFVLARLEAEGIEPSPAADKRTLLRRATYDLTGLPPTWEELQAFEADESPDAFARVVDRLLASPVYGEHWARHWLDVARYGDTGGFQGAKESRYPYSYTYRDYVVRSLNEDLPYDQFLREQIAADCLPTQREPRALAALGFLTAGPRFLNRKDEIVNDRIDVVTRGLMGLTVACARCHDHKFDAIPTKDYYSLAGIFYSSEIPDELPLIEEPKETPEYIAFKTELDQRERAVEQLLAPELPKLAEKLKKPADQLTGKEIRSAIARDVRVKYDKLQKEIQRWQTRSPHAPARAMVLRDRAKPSDLQVFIRGNPARRGEIAPRRFLAVLSGAQRPHYNAGSGRLQLAEAIVNPNNPLTPRVLVNRVWMHLFGAGLVCTPSNFGAQSEPPTHPELLDWLAARFMAEGWSMKKLQRTMLLSAAYQQQSLMRPDCYARDPENRLLWRMKRKRLQFEALRDTVLAAAGRLDRTIGGPPVDLAARPFSTRRTIYGLIDREFLFGPLRTFDFPSPDISAPERIETIVPPQALYLMNSPFVVEQAKHLAARPEAIATTWRRSSGSRNKRSGWAAAPPCWRSAFWPIMGRMRLWAVRCSTATGGYAIWRTMRSAISGRASAPSNSEKNCTG